MNELVCIAKGHTPGWFTIVCGGHIHDVYGCTRCKLREHFAPEKVITAPAQSVTISLALHDVNKDAIEFMRALRALVTGYREVLDADTPERPKLWQDLYPPLVRSFKLRFISRDLEDALCALVTALYNEDWGEAGE